MSVEEKPKRRIRRRKPPSEPAVKKRRVVKRVRKRQPPKPVALAAPPTAPPRAGPGPRPVSDWLRMRREVAARRPVFLRQESWRYRRIGPAWRKPKGVDSKMRLQRRGWPALVRIGYRGPQEARGLHPSGLRDVLVHTASELERVNPQLEAARLGGTLGARRRAELLEKAKQLGIRVLNPQGLREIRRQEAS